MVNRKIASITTAAMLLTSNMLAGDLPLKTRSGMVLESVDVRDGVAYAFGTDDVLEYQYASAICTAFSTMVRVYLSENEGIQEEDVFKLPVKASLRNADRRHYENFVREIKEVQCLSEKEGDISYARVQSITRQVK